MNPERLNAAFDEIARKNLVDVPTLKTRKSDSLDFHEVSVWSIKDALLAAFELGRKDALLGDNADWGPPSEGANSRLLQDSGPM